MFSGYTVNAGILEWPVPNKSDSTLRTWATDKPGQNQSTELPSWMAYSALQLVYGHIPGAMMTEDLLFVLENSKLTNDVQTRLNMNFGGCPLIPILQ